MEWEYTNKRECVVCKSPYIQRHHIFGGANRKISDRYGYIIPLCREHHTGDKGIHFNKTLRQYWQGKAQNHFEQNHGTREDFIRIFGRSYLE